MSTASSSAALFFAAVLLVVTPDVLGASPVSHGGPVGNGDPVQPEVEPAPLARSLAAIRADNIYADIHFLASDELGGRDTPSDGLLIAARYIRTRLQRLSFQPGAKDGYFHEYPLAHMRLGEPETHASYTSASGTRKFDLGVDYFFSSRMRFSVS